MPQPLHQSIGKRKRRRLFVFYQNSFSPYYIPQTCAFAGMVSKLGPGVLFSVRQCWQEVATQSIKNEQQKLHYVSFDLVTSFKFDRIFGFLSFTSQWVISWLLRMTQLTNYFSGCFYRGFHLQSCFNCISNRMEGSEKNVIGGWKYTQWLAGWRSKWKSVSSKKAPFLEDSYVTYGHLVVVDNQVFGRLLLKTVSQTRQL